MIIKECYCKTGKSTKKTNINKNTEYVDTDSLKRDQSYYAQLSSVHDFKL